MSKSHHPSPLIFTHASRTGGGCLRLVIERQYKRSKIFPFYVSKPGGTTRDSLESFLFLSEPEKKRFKVLAGHINFGLHKHYDEFTYLTLLRNPVKRIVSLYSYALSEPGYYLYGPVASNRMKLKDFAGSGLSPELNNGLTRMISGVEGVKFGQCTREMLELAKHNLDTYYSIFGITERYDESVLLMKRSLGWDTPYYKSRHISKNKLSEMEIPPDTLSVIEEHNALDVELYRHGCQKFQSLIDQQDSGFASELARFKKINRVLQKLSSPRNGYLALSVLDAYSRIRQGFK